MMRASAIQSPPCTKLHQNIFRCDCSTSSSTIIWQGHVLGIPPADGEFAVGEVGSPSTFACPSLDRILKSTFTTYVGLYLV